MKAGIQACTVEVERDGRLFTLVVQKITRLRDITARREWEGELTEPERKEALSALQLFGFAQPDPGVRSATLRIKRGDRSFQLLVEQPPLWFYDMATNNRWEGTLTEAERRGVIDRLARAAT